MYFDINSFDLNAFLRYETSAARSRRNAPMCPGYFPPPAASTPQSRSGIPGLTASTASQTNSADPKPQKKATKKREKQQEKRAEENIQKQYTDLSTGDKRVDEISKTLAKSYIETDVYDESTPASLINKQIKKLRKKIKEMNNLQAKFDNNEITHLSSEQKTKLAKRDEVTKQISFLEDLLLKQTAAE